MVGSRSTTAPPTTWTRCAERPCRPWTSASACGSRSRRSCTTSTTSVASPRKGPPMALFKRRLPTSTSSTEVIGLPETAAARGWQRVDGAPFDQGLADQIWHVTWSLYDRREPLSSNTANDVAPSRPNFHDAYRGEADG